MRFPVCVRAASKVEVRNVGQSDSSPPYPYQQNRTSLPPSSSQARSSIVLHS
jgi:hypothetical protein